ncbi:MAG: sporulation protein YunB [Clostridia bacterium]|nr:sporulation protein YunB [Clostridia bacterium]
MQNNKNKRLVKFITILSIAIVTFTMAINGITPIFETLCKDKAKSVATIICNEESTKIISNYKYEDLVTIYKDSNDSITMIKSNITPINLIISDVAEKIQKRLDKVEKEQVGIRLGSFTGTKIFSGRGPIIPITLSTVGNVETDLRSEFRSAGINQTIHRIYLQVDCKVNILTPYTIFEEGISNQVLIAENIIVGKIPESYYNLEGLEKSNAVDVIE